MTSHAFRPWVAKAMTAATLVAILATPAQAQLACGGTVGPGGTFTMTSDILACTASPVLTVVGPAVLDMAAHFISCGNGLSTGLLIAGKSAVVTNGVMTSCTIGVEVGGEGRHQIRGVNAGSSLFGFGVNSDANSLSGNVAVDTTNYGFEIVGQRNKITGNAARNTLGFHSSGNANVFSGNTAAGGSFATDSTTAGNKLKGNVVSGPRALPAGDAEDVGFRIDGERHALSMNTAVETSIGFRFLEGLGGHSVQGNVALGRSVQPDLFASSTGSELAVGGNRVKGNRAFAHLKEGFKVTATSHGNALNGNLGIYNGIDGADLNSSCGDNLWKKNLFGRASPGCVK